MKKLKLTCPLNKRPIAHEICTTFVRFPSNWCINLIYYNIRDYVNNSYLKIMKWEWSWRVAQYLLLLTNCKSLLDYFKLPCLGMTQSSLPNHLLHFVSTGRNWQLYGLLHCCYMSSPQKLTLKVQRMCHRGSKFPNSHTCKVSLSVLRSFSCSHC